MIDWDKNVIGPTVGVFGEPVSYAPKVGAVFALNGIFDEAYQEVDLSGGTAVMSVTPVLGVRTADCLQPPKQGDHLTILRTGATYVVKKPEPDSHGSTLLKLNYLSP